MSDSRSWTNAQENVFLLNVGKHLVLAPPGSGKTEILAARVTSALLNGVIPGEMISITFTNRAAKNMNLRVSELGDEKPFIGTLHKFGYRFLRANHTISAGVTLLDDDDAERFLSEAIDEVVKESKEKFREIKVSDAANFVRRRNQVELRLMKPGTDVSTDDLLMKIAKNYTHKKNECEAIDFDDVLHLTLHCLLYLSPKKMMNYRWGQLDEVQDLSDLQWRIVRELFTIEAHIVYFGDYDQSIYSFMGASQKILDIYTQGSTVHYLADNFRSPKYLIDFLNAYASSNMQQRHSSNINFHASNTKVGGSVAILNTSGTFDDEVREIIRKVIPDLTKRLTSSAILTRTNKDADAVSLELNKAGVGHDRVSGFDFFRRRVVKDLMAFLRVASNQHDRLAWARLISIFGRVDSLRASIDLVNHAFKLGIRPVDWLTGNGVVNSLDVFFSAFKNRRIVIFDTETTGLDTEFDDIVQIAAVEIINGEATDKVFEVYLNTAKSLDASSKVHGITADILAKKGCNPSDGLKGFAEFVRGDVLVGHNLQQFDLPILVSNLRRHLIEWIPPYDTFDTLTLSRQLYPKLKNHKLATLIFELGIKGKNTHNALDDVLATKELAKKIATDSLELSVERGAFVQSYAKYLEHFALKLAPAWQATQKAKGDTMNLADLIDRFCVYAVRAMQYKVEPPDQLHIDRLTMFLRINTKQQSLGKILSDYVPELSTYSESDLITGLEKLVVSTVHKAKGLEFDGVVVASCVQDVYPHFYAKSNDERSEDARLLYVALSRAKQAIVVSTHDTVRTPKGGQYPRFPSPFLDFSMSFPSVTRI